MPEVKEARVHALKRLSQDERAHYGLRVLTMRKWPQGIARTHIDLWIPTAGPSQDLLSDHREGAITWQEFIARYEQEQRTQTECRVIDYRNGQKSEDWHQCRSVEYLKQLSQGQTITVLCWESGEQCHRYRLKALVER
jgi:uncharacterized protein YeaO (DUF488 family)